MTPDQLREEIVRAISLLEVVASDLVKQLGPPLAIAREHGIDFQYGKRTADVVQVLKAVRTVSALDACCVLLGSGHTSECAALVRMIQDAIHEISFLSERDDTGGLPAAQQQFVDEFFAQPVPEPEARAQGLAKPRSVPKKKIHAAIARLLGAVNAGDTSSVQRMTQNLDVVASGFVHFSYRSTMEMYWGAKDEERFHMRGLNGTPRIPEHTRYVAGVAFSALAHLGALAIQLGRGEWYAQVKVAMERLGAACDEFDRARGRLMEGEPRLGAFPPR